MIIFKNKYFIYSLIASILWLCIITLGIIKLYRPLKLDFGTKYVEVSKKSTYIKSYTKQFNELMKQYRNRTARETTESKSSTDKKRRLYRSSRDGSIGRSQATLSLRGS
ncbi:hypothetical protein SLOPH_776 [Spraguea lophii 42_110]|uniref:Uncharacterized protein n=1 Tax=Spraguea lophii (strain 42_110) TaxID=1358809 RepID=S7XUA3_SPRLO|nr:hypothetical protein SLOPH_776 [Spraguea lophii 42_110]